MNSVAMDLKCVGTLSVLLRVKPGAPVVAYGHVPPAMVGTKWVDEHHWRVFAWGDGRLHVCRVDLVSEDGQPWDMDAIATHAQTFPHLWSEIE